MSSSFLHEVIHVVAITHYATTLERITVFSILIEFFEVKITEIMGRQILALSHH